MTDRIIADTSVALKWFLQEPLSDTASDLLKQDIELVAPDFLLLEVANGLRRRQRVGDIASADVGRAIAELPRAFAELLPITRFVVPALKLSEQLNHSVYDCLFLAVSRALAVRLLTADAKFVAKLAGTPYAQNVVLLADWKP